MARVFMIDWNRLDGKGDTVVKAENYKGYCEFQIRDIGDDRSEVCCYSVGYPRLTGDFRRLMQQVSNFQLFNFIEQSLDRESKIDDDWEYTNWRDELKRFALSYGSSNVYCYHNYNNSEVCARLSRQLPFSISEFNTKQMPSFEPCYFCQEYKIDDEKGVSLYLVVMLEKIKDEQNAHNEGDDLSFNYRVRFVGSGYPLSKFVAKIPMCEEEQIYKQKVENYKKEHKKYYDEQRAKICRMLSPRSGFWSHMTDRYSQEHWTECRTVRNGRYCKHYGSRVKRCYRNGCLSYHCYEITHSGFEAKQLFEKAFGPEITGLVKDNKFTKDKWSLLSNVSDVEFINAFNALMSYEMKFGNSGFHIDCFQDNAVVEERRNEMCSVIGRIQEWAKDPNKWTAKKLYDMALQSSK